MEQEQFEQTKHAMNFGRLPDLTDATFTQEQIDALRPYLKKFPDCPDLKINGILVTPKPEVEEPAIVDEQPDLEIK